jgi:hypothetical protein
MDAEPLLKCEAEVYLETVAEMTTSAKTAASAKDGSGADCP